MHLHYIFLSAAAIIAKLVFLGALLTGGPAPGWAFAAETAAILGLGITGLVLAARARREARWDGTRS
jgi:hypothetical protein